MTSGWAKATRSAASFSSLVATRPSRITVQSRTWTSTVGRPAWTIAPWTEAVRSCSVARSSVGALVPRAMTAKKATRTATAIQVERFLKASVSPARGICRGLRPRPKAGPKSRFRRSRGSRIVPITVGPRSSCARCQSRAQWRMGRPRCRLGPPRGLPGGLRRRRRTGPEHQRCPEGRGRRAQRYGRPRGLGGPPLLPPGSRPSPGHQPT